MNELFETQESLSPRLRWMQRHHITIIDDGETRCDIPPDKRYLAKHGMASVAAGRDEIEACVNACNALKINGWEGMP